VPIASCSAIHLSVVVVSRRSRIAIRSFRLFQAQLASHAHKVPGKEAIGQELKLAGLNPS
jgi:uncharacterized protein (UPF0212 family)